MISTNCFFPLKDDQLLVLQLNFQTFWIIFKVDLLYLNIANFYKYFFKCKKLSIFKCNKLTLKIIKKMRKFNCRTNNQSSFSGKKNSLLISFLYQKLQRKTCCTITATVRTLFQSSSILPICADKNGEWACAAGGCAIQGPPSICFWYLPNPVQVPNMSTGKRKVRSSFIGDNRNASLPLKHAFHTGTVVFLLRFHGTSDNIFFSKETHPSRLNIDGHVGQNTFFSGFDVIKV